MKAEGRWEKGRTHCLSQLWETFLQKFFSTFALMDADMSHISNRGVEIFIHFRRHSARFLFRRKEILMEQSVCVPTKCVYGYICVCSCSISCSSSSSMVLISAQGQAVTTHIKMDGPTLFAPFKPANGPRANDPKLN